MIDKQYFDKQYTMKPLNVASDLSKAALEQALIGIKFDYTSNKKEPYLLYIQENDLKVSKGLESFNNLKIKIEVFYYADTVYGDEWYLVDPNKKLIIYSPGA